MLLDYAGLVNQVQDAKDFTNYERLTLADIAIPDLTRIKVGETELQLAPQGLDAILNVLGIPKPFAKNIDKRNRQLLTQISEEMARLNDQGVVVKLFKDKIVSVFNNQNQFFTDEAFMTVVRNMLEDQQITDLYDFKGGHYDCENGEIIVDFTSKREEMLDVSGTDFKAPEELFRSSMTLKNSSSLRFATGITESIERIICSNMVTTAPVLNRRKSIRHKSEEFELNTPSVLKEFMKSSDPRGMEYLKAQARRAMMVNLSLRELVGIKEVLDKTSEKYVASALAAGDAIPESLLDKRAEVENNLKVSRIEQGYGRSIVELSKYGPKYLMQATTPVNAYKAWNVVTDFFSNSEFLNPVDRLNGSIFASGIIGAESFDLETQAPPQINWN